VHAYGAAAHEFRAFDTAGAIVGRYPTEGDGGGHLIEVAASPDDRWLAGGDSDGTTWIWRVSDRTLVARLRDHGERVSSLAFLGDATLVTGSWDGTLRIRDLAALELPLASLRADIERAWGLTLEDVILDAPR
jgi:WD40 repeat protein